jgi:AAA15 family ATPase/GTPase
MIKHIRIENYRGLNLELIDCTNINIIIGSTKTGKTTILEEIHYGGRACKTLVNSKDYRQLRRNYWDARGELPDKEKDISILEMGMTVIYKDKNSLPSIMVNNISQSDYKRKEIDDISTLVHPRLDNKPKSYSLSIHKMKTIINAFSYTKLKILLIDDIEIDLPKSAFKPSLKWILERAKKRNIQLFISTHSIEIVLIILKLDSETKNITFFNLDTKDKKLSGELLERIRFDRGLDFK